MSDHDHEHHHEHVPVPYKDAVEGFRLDKDEFFKTMAGSPIPEAERAAFEGLPYYPVDEAARLRRPGPRAVHRRRAIELPDPDLGREAPAGPSGRCPALRARWRAAPADRLHVRWGRRRVAVRPVPRPDERHRDLRRGPLPRPRARAGRHLLARLQPRLPPVVRVRREVLVPADAGREPAADPDRGRGAPGAELTPSRRARSRAARPPTRTSASPSAAGAAAP